MKVCKLNDNLTNNKKVFIVITNLIYLFSLLKKSQMAKIAKPSRAEPNSGRPKTKTRIPKKNVGILRSSKASFSLTEIKRLN